MKLRVRDYLSQLKVLLRPGRQSVVDGALNPIPRWGQGKAFHQPLYELFDSKRAEYKRQLEKFLKYQLPLEQIPRQRNGNITEPCWINRFLPPLDAISLYGFLAQENPVRFFEIGSGNSTMFARRAIQDQKLRTRITSFDPRPRADIDEICDEVHRCKLEDLDLSVFGQLEAGDILFFDGSHFVFENSDVVVFVLEVVPKLKSGVIVQVHDIFLPSDYPSNFGKYGWAEQYMLAAYFLGGSAGLDILLPNSFISEDAELMGVLHELWQKPLFKDIALGGASLWMRTK